MIPIEKRREPNVLLRYRKQPFASYSDMPADIKLEVKRQLIEEQGCLCAYCMARLPDAGDLDYARSDVTIEHWAPQNPDADGFRHDSLDYRNMLAVCDGNRNGGPREQTCDASKGNTLLIVNPLQKETLASVFYNSRGEIHSTNSDVENDLNKTLNLNCEGVSLPQRRKDALDRMRRVIFKKNGDKALSKKTLRDMLSAFESETGKKTPYVGILIWWLRKRLERCG